MTRGFITLAVGKDSYYKLANNLLWSYRNTNSPDIHTHTHSVDNCLRQGE